VVLGIANQSGCVRRNSQLWMSGLGLKRWAWSAI